MFPDVMAAARGDTDAPAGSRWIETPEGRMRYLEAGRGPPVLLVHGATMTADDPAAALFDTLAVDHHVIALDRPGHGWSDRRRGAQSTVQAQGRALLQAAAALEMDRAVLVGHSYGGAVVVAMALQRPDAVAGVVALGPVVLPEFRLEHMLFTTRTTPGWGDAFMETASRPFDRGLLTLLWEAQFKPQNVPARFRETFPYERAKIPAQIMATGEDAGSLFASLTEMDAGISRLAVPVRVLAGTADLVVNPMHGQALARRAPDGQIEMLPGLGHMIHWFAQDKVRERVVELSGA